MHVEIHGHLNDVQIAGALAIAKQRAFHAISSSQQTKLGGGGACTAIVVGVQTDDETVAVFDVRADPLDLVGIDIGHGDLDRIRQIENHLSLRRGLPDIHHGLADLFGKLDLRGAKALG